MPFTQPSTPQLEQQLRSVEDLGKGCSALGIRGRISPYLFLFHLGIKSEHGITTSHRTGKTPRSFRRLLGLKVVCSSTVRLTLKIPNKTQKT